MAHTMSCAWRHWRRILLQPVSAALASFSNVVSSVFGVAYSGYHQPQLSLINSWVTLAPSGSAASAMVRPYLSWPWM